jgi:hypothetical protein
VRKGPFKTLFDLIRIYYCLLENKIKYEDPDDNRNSDHEARRGRLETSWLRGLTEV